jgi:hypothetical protein
MSKLSVADRERAISKHLNEAKSASAREIYEAVSAKLEDSVTREAYYKVIGRMEIAGKIEVQTEDSKRGRIYALTPTLNSDNPITLDDLYEYMPYLPTTQAIASAIDARDYYEENRRTILRRTAQALLDEEPIDLFHRMLIHMIQLVEKDLIILRHQEIADAYSRHRFEQDYKDLEQVAYRGLSLPHDAIHLPGLNKLFKSEEEQIIWNSEELKKALQERIFGEKFIYPVDVSSERDTSARQKIVVSGSDGSTHAGTLALKTAKGYFEDIGDIITFNNSTVYVRLSPFQQKQIGKKGMLYGAPLTRQTLDDPSYKGMVLAPFMYPDLSESEYEHMAKCAADVVQFRVDEEIFTGKAYDITPPQRSQIPKPQVHIRDGTITPQEREFGHYNRSDAYGEMVREGIRRERTILERIISARTKPPIFAGAVKSTQMRVFSRLVNWYISIGSAERFGQAIEPDWSISRAAAISDNAAMTALLSELDHNQNEGKYYVTCALIRQFPSLTEYYNYQLRESQTWLDFFEQKREEADREHDEYGGTVRYHATVDLADDDFIFMCEKADFAYFYVGHTAGDPPPMIPRYEFLTSLRDKSPEKASVDVLDLVRRLVDAIDAAGLAYDRDHNFMSSNTLIKILPYPIQQAHEYAKTLGKKLEAELKSIVISRLIELKRLRSSTSDIIIRPLAVRNYLESFKRAIEKDQDGIDEIR